MRTFVNFLSLVLVALSPIVITSFQSPSLSVRRHHSSHSRTAVYGLFDGFIKSMESGYSGGDDSPYAKQKAVDDKRRSDQQEKVDARKAKGYTELKDVKKRTFVKMKYNQKKEPEPEPEEEKEKKKLFGLF
eukprot:CAMPEP_0194369988 /NCGR_PEP_ID=MMETSP0174-20130528/18359_1 /TAXON_ID=216777 /ORGANISM="Proboscia alata, Strain PI-D3" /LENGTH=130 /DNA_ID=CAMNT_0039147261 /DNA_START=58 /DNA_END=450 /DNA_ORIENTATION=-